MAKTNPISANPSLLLLIAANLLPVGGVLLWGWSVFEIVALYWFENVIIGAFNVLKMLMAAGEPAGHGGGTPGGSEEMPGYLRKPAQRATGHGIKLFLIPFFTFHYGLFCFVHGMFVFVLLGGSEGGMDMKRSPSDGIGDMISEISLRGGKWFVLAVIISHLFSFFANFIGKGEFRRTSAPALMQAPYGRIVVLHIAILFGAFVIAFLGSPVFLLLLLIAGKIILDAKLHLKSHGKPAETKGNLA
ncbi:hypothetical protein HZ994_11120 [Akkermansiaceae bacterium]|nr:hypothetical protein HZ994_11120 [Akkermansiaceae bacterium]